MDDLFGGLWLFFVEGNNQYISLKEQASKPIAKQVHE